MRRRTFKNRNMKRRKTMRRKTSRKAMRRKTKRRKTKRLNRRHRGGSSAYGIELMEKNERDPDREIEEAQERLAEGRTTKLREDTPDEKRDTLDQLVAHKICKKKCSVGQGLGVNKGTKIPCPVSHPWSEKAFATDKGCCLMGKGPCTACCTGSNWREQLAQKIEPTRRSVNLRSREQQERLK